MRINNMLSEFQKKLDYKFNEPELLMKALTHSSYANEQGLLKIDSNERLEFLGDAVLELVISEHIYNTQTSMPEGDMTKLRAAIVCEESLSYHAKRLGFGDYIFLGKGERAAGGSYRASLLADAFEAVLGAIFLDSGIENARKFAIGILTDDAGGKGEKIDYKTDLQEFMQRTSKEPVLYKVISETGPDHEKKFVSTVSHMGKVIGTGEGKSKKESEQRAAGMALASLTEKE